ncbi:hypothetical protein VKS41_002327 [Umbelopsis sp. WA50703]|jgi:hypothetical protein
MSSVPIPIIATAIITCASLSIVAISTVVYVHIRRRRQAKPIEVESVMGVQTGSSEFAIDEGKISLASLGQAVPPVITVNAISNDDDNQDTQYAYQEDQESLVSGEITDSEETDDEDQELTRVSSEDSACFANSPQNVRQYQGLSCLPEGSLLDEEEGQNDDCCQYPLKRDWTELDVTLPEVHMSSQESILEAVVSISVP